MKVTKEERERERKDRWLDDNDPIFLGQSNKTAGIQQKWFEQYTESDNRDVMTPDGCQQFYTDLGVNLESVK